MNEIELSREDMGQEIDPHKESNRLERGDPWCSFVLPEIPHTGESHNHLYFLRIWVKYAEPAGEFQKSKAG